MRAFLALLGRDLRLVWRRRADAATALLFFVLCAVAFPLALGPEMGLLQEISTATLWVCALFSGLLTFDSLLREDFADGTLDMLALSPLSFESVAVAKGLAHWLTTGVPLVLAAPLWCLFMGLPAVQLIPLCLSLLAGTAALSLMGMVMAAVLLNARRNSLLVPVLLLPVFVPLLVFGTAASRAEEFSQPFILLLAVALSFLAICPLLAGAALRHAVQDGG